MTPRKNKKTTTTIPVASADESPQSPESLDQDSAGVSPVTEDSPVTTNESPQSHSPVAVPEDIHAISTPSIVPQDSPHPAPNTHYSIPAYRTGRPNTKTLLIPYLAPEAAGEELKYALRTWEKNYDHPLTVVIIGDREPWFSDKIAHIPHEVHKIDEDCGCLAPKKVRNPQADVAHKLITAIAAGAVEGDFILTNDDIFLLGHTTQADIELLKAFGTLEKGVGTRGGIYNENALRTARLLKAQGLPTHRYGTHTPVWIHAGTLTKIVNKYKAIEQGVLLTSLYFNEQYPTARPVQVDGGPSDTILASVYRADPDKAILQHAIEHRKFINSNSKGWTALKPIFEELYPEKSSFEN